MGKNKEKKPTLYVKLPNGRYQEYVEPADVTATDSDTIYRKRYSKTARRVVYEPIGLFYDGQELREGVWVVARSAGCCGSSSLTEGNHLRSEVFGIEYCSPLANVSLSELGSMQKLAVYLSSRFDDVWRERNSGISQYEFCARIVRMLFEYEKEKNKQDGKCR